MPETYQEFIDRIKREAMADEMGLPSDLSQTPEEMDRIIGAFPDGMLPLPPGGNPMEVFVPRAGVPPLPLEPTSLSAGRAFPGDVAPPIFASPVEEAAPEGPTGGTYAPVDIPLARAPRDPEFYADTDRRGRRQIRRQLREPLDLARTDQYPGGPLAPESYTQSHTQRPLGGRHWLRERLDRILGPHQGQLDRMAAMRPEAIAAWMASMRKEGEALAQGPASGMMRRRLAEMQAALEDPDTSPREKILLRSRIEDLREEIETQRGLEERKVGGEEHLNLARGRREMFGSGSRATPHITTGEYNSELDRIGREHGPLAADQYARQTGLTVGGRTGVFTPEELPLGQITETARGSSVGADGTPVLGETTVTPSRLPIYNPTAMNMASAEAGDYRAVTNPLTGNTTLVPKEGFEILQPLDETGRPTAGARGEMMPAGTAADRRETARLDREKIAAEQAEGGRTFYSPRNISEGDLEEALELGLVTGGPGSKEKLAEWANEVLTHGPGHKDWEEFKQFRAKHSGNRRSLAADDAAAQERSGMALREARENRMGTSRQKQAAMDSQLRRLGMAMTSGYTSGSGVRANVYPGAPGLAGMDPRVQAAYLQARAAAQGAANQGMWAARAAQIGNEPMMRMLDEQNEKDPMEEQAAEMALIAATAQKFEAAGFPKKVAYEKAHVEVTGRMPPAVGPGMGPGPGTGKKIMDFFTLPPEMQEGIGAWFNDILGVGK